MFIKAQTNILYNNGSYFPFKFCLDNVSLYAKLYLLYLSIIYFIFFITVSSKGETEPERKETRQKVDEDRKHEYPFQQNVSNSVFILPL